MLDDLNRCIEEGNRDWDEIVIGFKVDVLGSNLCFGSGGSGW